MTESQNPFDAIAAAEQQQRENQEQPNSNVSSTSTFGTNALGDASIEFGSTAAHHVVNNNNNDNSVHGTTAGTTGSSAVGTDDDNDEYSSSNTRRRRGKNYLIIRITTRPINSWSPKLIHPDGTQRTLTIDLPEELAASAENHHHTETLITAENHNISSSSSSSVIVITQQGWQDLFHIIATATAKNTSESILIFWFSTSILIVTALVLLFQLVRSLRFRLLVFVSVLGFCIAMGIAHTIIRRIRVQQAVTKCVQECFYDNSSNNHEQQQQYHHNEDGDGGGSGSNSIAAASIGLDDNDDIELHQHQNISHSGLVAMGGLDELQDLENARGLSTKNPQDIDDDDNDNENDNFSKRMIMLTAQHQQQSVSSHASSTRIRGGGGQRRGGNRQRLNTNSSDATKDSNMIFEETTHGSGRRRTKQMNKATSRDGMYTVDWQWEYFGLDAVVRISW